MNTVELFLLRGLLVVGLILGAYGYGLHSGRVGGEASVRSEWAQAEAKRAAQAASEAGAIRQVEDNERRRNAQTLAALSSRVGDALYRLRDRPERPAFPASGASSAAPGAGGTGAGLFAEDARFLVGEAARADRLRAALAECYAVVDAPEKVAASAPAR